MIETFLALLTAHLTADFPLQPAWMVQRKKKPAVLSLHIALVAVVAILTVGAWPASLLLILVTTHLVMDAIKVYVLRDSLLSFSIDQVVHLAVIGALAIAYPQTVSHGLWSRLPHDMQTTYFVGLCLLSGTIASLQVGSIIIRKGTALFIRQIGDQLAGLDNGGTYIGYLERALVMILILMGQPAGVGFLITAKSILRFGDVKESNQRKLTEYIIIGTFMSFGWGLLIAVLTQFGVQHWLTAI